MVSLILMASGRHSLYHIFRGATILRLHPSTTHQAFLQTGPLLSLGNETPASSSKATAKSGRVICDIARQKGKSTQMQAYQVHPGLGSDVALVLEFSAQRTKLVPALRVSLLEPPEKLASLPWFHLRTSQNSRDGERHG